jgi:hypothetical protein
VASVGVEERAQVATRVLVSTEADGWHEVLANDAAGSAIVVADAKAVLAQVPDSTFQTTITSPPYWSLRDYGIDGQIGCEWSVEKYIEAS